MNYDPALVIGVTSVATSASVALFVLIWKQRKNGYKSLEEKVGDCVDKLSELSNLDGKLGNLHERLASIEKAINDQLSVGDKRMELAEKRLSLLEKSIEKHMAQNQESNDAINKRLERLERQGGFVN